MPTWRVEEEGRARRLLPLQLLLRVLQHRVLQLCLLAAGPLALQPLLVQDVADGADVEGLL